MGKAGERRTYYRGHSGPTQAFHQHSQELYFENILPDFNKDKRRSLDPGVRWPLAPVLAPLLSLCVTCLVTRAPSAPVF